MDGMNLVYILHAIGKTEAHDNSLVKNEKNTIIFFSLPLCVHNGLGVGTLGHGLGLDHGSRLVALHYDFFDENHLRTLFIQIK